MSDRRGQRYGSYCDESQLGVAQILNRLTSAVLINPYREFP
jgi:hypothetical protein